MNSLIDRDLYEKNRITISEAQNKVYSTVNFVMVETYWNIGKKIYEAQGESERAEYGAGHIILNTLIFLALTKK